MTRTAHSNCDACRTTTMRRRSAAAVCWGLATFLMLQAGFHYPISCWWPQLQDVEFGEKQHLLTALLRERSPEQPLVLGLGSSLTGMGLRPGEMAQARSNPPARPLVFNYAIKGGLIVVQRICLQRLLAEGIHPDLLLVETYPPFYLMDNQNDPSRILDHFPSHRFQRTELALVTGYCAEGHRVRQEWRAGECVPWHFRRNYLVNKYLPRWVPKAKRIHFDQWHTDAWGWDSCPIFYEQASALYQTAAHQEALRKRVETWNQQQLDERLDQALRDLLSKCRHEKIGVMLVWPPECGVVRDSYNSALTERCRRWFATLEADTGAPLVNARAWLDDAKFADGLHLTPEGAGDYTRRLEREMLKRLHVEDTRTAHR